ncbi:PLP-dependent transferase [Aspergillus campestris IBT 28561]|uniref:PLP-dependent transferase n=1 Tax=Aspergillus campestris (strain IBT 28561) TaxID=1392248 RepID=A0A2I1D1U0_ASPC2|nr:PLP-dependent transferase [Aspergillus campestris IBT 28561]PKY03826.1 PLP-dependent transferase [Aspergillus campestris IBT 28561]
MATAYNEAVDTIRPVEYPSLTTRNNNDRRIIYLDHAGATLYPRSLVNAYTTDLQSAIYGNPHSESTPSRASSARVADARTQLLRFFGASPLHFDLVFTANATAAVKLVGECLAQGGGGRGFRYVYHQDAHTSLVGVRQMAAESVCLEDDAAVERWIRRGGSAWEEMVTLLGYPGQSNMTGRRLPRSWPAHIRGNSAHRTAYTLWDAAALASTSPLSLSDVDAAPDFTAVSLYKIFGLPDVGCLIVRKASAHLLVSQARYFGGGTVDMVANSSPGSSSSRAWHAVKTDTLHDALEDGTLPFHSLLAVGHAVRLHEDLLGGMARVSAHCAFLASQLYTALDELRHANGSKLVRVYTGSERAAFGDPALQGPTVAMAVVDPAGRVHGYADVERAADADGVYFRSGSVCNPGGMSYLGWTKMHDRVAAFEAGHRCSAPIQEVGGRATGIVRVSLGAMSSLGDVDGFVEWLARKYLDVYVDDRGSSSFSLGAFKETVEEGVVARRYDACIVRLVRGLVRLT